MKNIMLFLLMALSCLPVLAFEPTEKPSSDLSFYTNCMISSNNKIYLEIGTIQLKDQSWLSMYVRYGKSNKPISILLKKSTQILNKNELIAKADLYKNVYYEFIDGVKTGEYVFFIDEGIPINGVYQKDKKLEKTIFYAQNCPS